MDVEIPKGDLDTPGPYWLPFVDHAGRAIKPRIRYKCGELYNIGLHYVHTDGRVTASFYHAKFSSWTEGGKTYTHEPGCGWHVFLKLLDYDLGDFPPQP